jgi:hypothetical protein
MLVSTLPTYDDALSPINNFKASSYMEADSNVDGLRSSKREDAPVKSKLPSLSEEFKLPIQMVAIKISPAIGEKIKLERVNTEGVSAEDGASAIIITGNNRILRNFTNRSTDFFCH